jgi:alkylation response protein AidB-like acyl-CoA dehydrogenase
MNDICSISMPNGAGLDEVHDILLARARAVAPTIASEATASEQASTLTPSTVSALAESELFWMFVPREANGVGADIGTVIEVLEEISRADGSAGWTLMANSMTTAAAAAFLSDAGIKELFGGPRRAIIAGQVVPVGRAVEVEGGLRGGGRYQFASGSAHATHIGAGFHVLGTDGKPRMLAPDIPDARIGFIPRDRGVFKGNWNVMGMCGTGSYDLEVPEQFVPADMTMELFAARHKRGRAGFGIGLIANGYAGHSAVALGLMKRALEEVVRIATSKTRLGYMGPTADHPIFRHQFSLKEAAYRAARGYLLEVFTGADAAANAGEPISAEQDARFKQAAVFVHNTASDVIHFCHMWGSSAAIRNPSPLGRCTRDIATATQHVLIDQKVLADAAPNLMAAWLV